jgi:hypothetical protein
MVFDSRIGLHIGIYFAGLLGLDILFAELLKLTQMFFNEPQHGSKLRDFSITLDSLRHARADSLNDGYLLEDNIPFAGYLQGHQVFIIKPSESVSELSYK